jgi:hypothetical protein
MEATLDGMFSVVVRPHYLSSDIRYMNLKWKPIIKWSKPSKK